MAACPVCSVRPLRLDGIRVAAEYEGVVQQMVRSLKYQEHAQMARPLAALLARPWQQASFPIHYLIPVPLHPRRLRERGYNQAVLLACALAQTIDVPMLSSALARSRDTQSQTKFLATERRLIDDVCTTGSTLEACADALRNAGADKVYALTVARARRDPLSGAADDTI